jgi:multimeric flavodoxin WrbA
MKHISVISGSPRKGGNSETLTKAFLSFLPENTELDWFFVSDMNIGDCASCRRCWSNGNPCVINDDMEQIYSSITRADILIFVSPLYWFSWSAQIKRVIDRLYPYTSEKALSCLAGKNAVLVCCGADSEQKIFEGLLSSFRQMCNHMGLTISGEFCETGLDDRDEALRRRDIIEKMGKEGHRILSEQL